MYTSFVGVTWCSLGLTSDGGIVLTSGRTWFKLTRRTTWFFISDVISCNLCWRGLPSKRDGIGGQRGELKVGRRLNRWLNSWPSCDDIKFIKVIMGNVNQFILRLHALALIQCISLPTWAHLLSCTCGYSHCEWRASTISVQRVHVDHIRDTWLQTWSMNKNDFIKQQYSKTW